MAKMDLKKTAKKSLPYIVGIVVFAALSALYFAPQFSGKELVMHDIVQYQGMSKEIVDHIDTYEEDPQWTGAMFGGMPAQLIHMHYDSMVLKWVMTALDFMGRPASMIFVAMLAFFVMLLLFRVNPWVAIVPAIAYGLSTYSFLIIDAGHITKMLAFAYAPMVVGGVYYTLRRNMWVGAALTALFASLEISANHPQITYYFLFVLLALWINELVRASKEKLLPRFAKATGLLIIAAVFAVGSNLAPLHYINEYGKVSMRGGSELSTTEESKQSSGLDIEYATQWSYGKVESFNMLVPNLMGGTSIGGFSDDGKVAESLTKYGARNLATQLPAYWGDQPMTGGPTYLGAVVIFLAVLGLFLLRGRYKWWVLAVSAVVVMLAWGGNFMWFTKLFFNYLPGYNKFRTVTMILVVVQWSVPFLAALVLHKVYKQGLTQKEITKGVLNTLYVVGGVLMLFLLLGGSIFDFTSPMDGQMGLPDDVLAAMESERATMMKMDALRSLIFVVLTAGVVLLYGRQKIKGWALLVGVGVLICADLIPVNMRYLPQSKFVEQGRAETKPTEVDLQILQDTELGYRVLNLTASPFSDATTSYFHRSVGGYHGAKLQRYQEIIDRYLSRGDIGTINMLNTKYIITADKDGKRILQENYDRNGAAWFVSDVVWVQTADEELAMLGEIDNKRTAIIDKRFEAQIENSVYVQDSTAVIEMVEYRSNYLKYRSGTSARQLALFSEIYYDRGWSAFMDGVEVPYLRADYILRALEVDEGEHTIEFRYRAPNFNTISAITLTFSLLIIGGLIAAAIYGCRRGRGACAQECDEKGDLEKR